MHPGQFLSPDTTAHIEPTTFVAHILAYRGADATTVGVRQTVILSFIPELERRLLRTLGSPSPQPHPVQRQTVYNPIDRPFSVLASPMGAPMAVMLLEQLIALGARRFLYLGFCGALDTVYRIGDCCIPTTAIREEGTSYHYLPHDVIPATAEPLNAVVWEHAQRQHLVVRQGPIWTTDAPYRETAAKIHHFQSAGVHVVDMEMAALCTVAAYRGCEITALLLISDECYHPTWRPGFGAAGLRQACQNAVNACVTAATHIAMLP